MRGLDPERFYVSTEAAFNVVLLDSGRKVDLILRKERPFSRAEFERRQPAEIAGVAVLSPRPRTPSWPSSSGRAPRNPSGSFAT